MGCDRRERGGGDRGGFFDSQSKADEVDSWVSKKSNSFNTIEPSRRSAPGFDRRSSFDSLQTRDTPRDLDNWGRKREEAPSSGGGERPRLMLQRRTLPVVFEEVKKPVALPVIEEVKKEELVVVPKPKGPSPFGQARPREEVLAEKGQDWREIEEKLEVVKIKETVGAERADRGKSSFGLGNVRAPVERSWRKNESVDGLPWAVRASRRSRPQIEKPATFATESSETGRLSRAGGGALRRTGEPERDGCDRNEEVERLGLVVKRRRRSLRGKKRSFCYGKGRRFT